MLDFTPAHDRVLLKVLVEETTSGGLYIPTMTHNPTLCCKVVAVGPGTEDHPVMTFKVDDKVLIVNVNLLEIRVNGEKMYVVRDHDILGTVQ